MSSPKIGIVGPCAAGKTTLSAGLARLGYSAKTIAQEHSFVPSMWQQITRPDVLVYLDASYPITLKRKNLNWTETEYMEEVHRLQHAREHADLYLNTDELSIEEVLHAVLNFLQDHLLDIPPE